jgi:hypothetical protein
MPQLSADRYVAEIGASTAGLAEILAEYDQSLPIPTCPEWTLRQLVTHVGRAHRRGFASRAFLRPLGSCAFLTSGLPAGAACRTPTGLSRSA